MSSLIHVTVRFIKHVLLPYLIYNCSINDPKNARGVFNHIYILFYRRLGDLKMKL